VVSEERRGEAVEALREEILIGRDCAALADRRREREDPAREIRRDPLFGRRDICTLARSLDLLVTVDRFRLASLKV
jgi:hypothetical protein